MFVGGTNGVWVGSRMGENTLPMDCTDPAYVDEPVRRVVLDRANDNTVRANRFVDVTYGVRVEDDGNRVEGNTFEGDRPDRHAVIVGTPLRTTVLGRPVHGHRAASTTCRRSPATPIRTGGSPATSTPSTAATPPRAWPAALCEGVEPPRSPFVFVIAVALAGTGWRPARRDART